MSKQESFFKTKVVPAKPGSGKLWDEEFVVDDKPVTCLRMEFENDEARRAYFTELLRQKLKDPEFRMIEGFPIGEDEDILKLSDPPYSLLAPILGLPILLRNGKSRSRKRPQIIDTTGNLLLLM